MRNGPKPGVGSTGRGLTLNQVLVDWRATVNGTQNAPTGAQQFKPGDRAMRGSLEVSVVAVDSDAAWVRYQDGSHATINFRDLELIPAHPLPSEPNTAWVDANGDVFVVWQDGTVRDYYGMTVDPEHISGPFTRLVPEGSEREAAIREAADLIEGTDWKGAAVLIRKHFLSGVDQ